MTIGQIHIAELEARNASLEKEPLCCRTKKGSNSNSLVVVDGDETGICIKSNAGTEWLLFLNFKS